MLRKPACRERYPLIQVKLIDLGYYWEHVKIRSSDYGNFLKQVDMEHQLLDGSADAELKKISRSVEKRGLLNPLIITQILGRLYVLVGCQRLASLRYLAHIGAIAEDTLVPCRMAEGLDEEVVLKFHPYKNWK